MDTSTTSCELIDVSAEETCPAPSIPVPRSEQTGQETGQKTKQATKQQSTAERIARLPPAATFEGQPTAAARAAPLPSAATFALMDRLEALAADVAQNGSVKNGGAKSEDTSSDQPIESIPKSPDLSPGLPLTEPTISVSPRPGFENDPFVSRRAPSRGRGKIILASFVAAALVGGAFAWQSTSTPIAQAPAPDPVPPRHLPRKWRQHPSRQHRRQHWRQLRLRRCLLLNW